MPDNDTDQSEPEGGDDDMTAALLEEPTGLDDTRVTDPTVYAGALGDDPDTEISVAADVEATLLTALAASWPPSRLVTSTVPCTPPSPQRSPTSPPPATTPPRSSCELACPRPVPCAEAVGSS
jgi:hypothetical protein